MAAKSGDAAASSPKEPAESDVEQQTVRTVLRLTACCLDVPYTGDPPRVSTLARRGVPTLVRPHLLANSTDRTKVAQPRKA